MFSVRRSKQRRGGVAESGFRSGYVTLEGLKEKSNEQQVCRSRSRGERFKFKSHQCTRNN